MVLLAQQIENGKCKIENYGVTFGDDCNILPKVIPQFSTFNCQFSITGVSPVNTKLLWPFRHFTHRGGKGPAGRVTGGLAAAEQATAEIRLTGRAI